MDTKWRRPFHRRATFWALLLVVLLFIPMGLLPYDLPRALALAGLLVVAMGWVPSVMMNSYRWTAWWRQAPAGADGLASALAAALSRAGFGPGRVEHERTVFGGVRQTIRLRDRMTVTVRTTVLLEEGRLVYVDVPRGDGERARAVVDGIIAGMSPGPS